MRFRRGYDLFSYNEQRIHSAAPLAEIKAYLNGLGAEELPGQVFKYEGLEIRLIPYINNELPDLGVPRHTVDVTGEKEPAERFLNAFRMRFLSAGG